MGKLDGKVAVISGAARGQGRTHAVTLAREGATVVAFDLCAGFEHSLTPAATESDLEETARLVEQEGQRCIAAKVDARDLPALTELADRAMTELGRVDILVVNHGMWIVTPNAWELEEEAWEEEVGCILTGAWKVTKAFIPKILEGERGGAITITGSANTVQPQPSAVAYTSAKHGIIGLMRTLAWELGEHRVRVNCVAPGGVNTPLLNEGGTLERAMEYRPEYINHNRSMLPTEWHPPEAVSKAILFLVSDDAEYVTGTILHVDSGWTHY